MPLRGHFLKKLSNHHFIEILTTSLLFWQGLDTDRCWRHGLWWRTTWSWWHLLPFTSSLLSNRCSLGPFAVFGPQMLVSAPSQTLLSSTLLAQKVPVTNTSSETWRMYLKLWCKLRFWINSSWRISFPTLSFFQQLRSAQNWPAGSW